MLLNLLDSIKTPSLLSDAAKYMLAAEAILRFLYSKLFYVTCGTRLLHSCAMAVKFHFEGVIELIETGFLD